MKKSTLKRNCRAKWLRFKRRNPAGSLVVYVAGSLTFLWFVLEGLFIAVSGVSLNGDKLALNTLGDFLAGTFAPVAVIWFVAAFYLQKIELSLQRHELRLQRKETARLALQATRQADSVALNERHTRRDLFSRVLDQGYGELTAIATKILVSCKTPVFFPHRDAALKARGAGYKDAFIDGVIDALAESSSTPEVTSDHDLFQALVWSRILREWKCLDDCWRFQAIVETLIKEAQFADADGSLEQQFKGGRAFTMYQFLEPMRRFKSEIAADAISLGVS